MTETVTKPSMPRIACITLDLETDAFWLPVIQCEMLEMPSRILQFRRILDEYGIKLTVFAVGRLIQERPRYLEQLAQLGAEFELHSYSHNSAQPDSQEEIERGVEAYAAFFGKPPTGYRAPVGLVSPAGFKRLLKADFKYDASIMPSLRLDEYRYNHLDKPTHPYQQDGLMELPFAVVPTIRLPLSLSYIKLLGPSVYNVLFRLFGLPPILVLDSHPYDYFPTRAQAIRTGWKRYAHARNAPRAMDIFRGFVDMLARQGYQFWFMSQLYQWASDPNSQRVELDAP